MKTPFSSNISKKSLPWVLVIQVILSSLYILDKYNVKYYPLIHRVTVAFEIHLGINLILPITILLLIGVYINYTENNAKNIFFVLIPLLLYPIIGLESSIIFTSILSVLFSLAYLSITSKFFSIIIILLIIIDLLSLIHWTLSVPYNLHMPFLWFSKIETGIYYIGVYFAPLFLVTFLYMWVYKIFFKLNSNNTNLKNHNYVDQTKIYFLFLIFCLLLGIYISFYPYNKHVNPNNLGVGVDIKTYIHNAQIVNNDPFKIFEVAGGSRPALYFLIFFISRTLHVDINNIVKFLPALLNPLLTLSTYFITMEFTKDIKISVWASFFTITGISSLVGIYSHYLANILGLSMFYFSMCYLSKSMRTKKKAFKINIITSLFFGFLLVFTHTGTFIQYFTTLILTSIYYFLNNKDNDIKLEQMKIIILYIIFIIFSELLKSYLSNGSNSYTTIISASNHLTNISSFWYNLIFNFRLLYGGLMANILLLGLSAVGLYVLNINEYNDLFLTTLIAITSLTLLVSDKLLMSRIIYNLPIGIYASLGYNFLKKKYSDYYKPSYTAFIILFSLAYIFRSLANII